MQALSRMRTVASTLVRLSASVAAAVFVTACAPQLHHASAVGEMRELARVHAVFDQPDADLASPCVDAGAVRGRLITDGTLANQGQASAALTRAAEALLAVCGTAQMQRWGGDETAELAAARVRWKAEMQRELVVSCRAIQDAATALGESPPDCAASSAPTSSS